MGVVYVAIDSRLKREVALKIVHPHIASEPELRHMFRSEAESMARLRHPNVVEIYDIGEVDGRPYLVMPNLRAVDLAQWTRRRGGPPLPVDIVVGLLGQAASGLTAMHAAGLVHGDIKPHNLLVSEGHEVVVADLGLARSARRHVDIETLGGTPGYLAPEIIAREPAATTLAHKADVYALGVTGYWLLVGHTPFGRGHADDVFERQLQGEILPPSEVRPELSKRFDAPLMRAIHRDPAQRPSVAELREALFAARDEAQDHDRRQPFVVVVDDDADVLVLVRELIMAVCPQAEVVALQDSEAALSLIESRPPSLVLTDLQMPGLNGLELLAAMRGYPATQSVPVIVMTGVGGAQDWQLLRSLGASRFMVKPIEPQMLLDVVAPMLTAPKTASRAG